VTTRKQAIEAAKKIVLEKEASLITKTGEAHNVLKLQIYDELRSNGLGYEADLLMTFDAALRASMNSQSNVTYNFQGGQFGVVNFGTQIGNINTSLTALSSKNDEASKNFAKALKELTQAVVNSPELNEQQKKEALDILSLLAKQGEEPPEKRQPGVLKPVLEAIPKILSSGSALVTLWQAFGPHITGFLGL
jgi:hypothetical protein